MAVQSCAMIGMAARSIMQAVVARRNMRIGFLPRSL
jgi:hypothetical protein